MTTNNSNSNNSLTKISLYQLQKYNSHPVVQIPSVIAKLEESAKTVWSNECDKSTKNRLEFEVWNKYDANHG